MKFDLFSAISDLITSPRRYKTTINLAVTGGISFSDRRLPKFLVEFFTIIFILVLYIWANSETGVFDSNSSSLKNSISIYLPITISVIFIVSNIVFGFFTKNYVFIDRLLCNLIYICMLMTSVIAIIQLVFDITIANEIYLYQGGSFCKYLSAEHTFYNSGLFLISFFYIFGFRFLPDLKNKLFTLYDMTCWLLIITASVYVINFVVLAPMIKGC